MMLTNTGDGVLATGIVRAHVTGECDRCLDVAHFEVAGEIEEYYLFEEPEDPESYEDGFELVSEDRTIDLSDAIADAVVMDTPFVVDVYKRQPERMAIIWDNPHGSKSEGMRNISAPAYMRCESAGSNSMRAAI